MFKSIESIIEWHKEHFPVATLKGQRDKWIEELNEFNNATGKHRIEELADLFIVACGIARFSTIEAMNAFAQVDAAIQMDRINGVLYDFQQFIENKMIINTSRKWKIDNGQYKHIENQ